MARYQIADLREQRARLNDAMTATLDEIADIRTDSSKVEDPDKARAELREKYAKQEKDFDDLTKEIEDREKRELHGKPALEARDALDPGAGDEAERRAEQRAKDPEALAHAVNLALRSVLQKGWDKLTPEERTTLNVTTAADGGNAVAAIWGDLQESLREASPIRAESQLYSSTSGADLILPRVTAAATAPGRVDEEAGVPNDAETFGQIVIKAFMYAKEVKASRQMLTDAVFPVESFIGRRLGFDLGLATGAELSTGTGTGTSGDTQPQGVFTCTTATGLTALSGLTYATCVTLQHSVLGPYRQGNAVWVCKDATLGDLRTLTDTTGRPLYQVDMRVGKPDTLLGDRIVLDPNAPANSTGLAPLVYGNLKRGYLVRDVQGVLIERLNELHALNLQVGFLGSIRTGGGIVDPNALRKAVRA